MPSSSSALQRRQSSISSWNDYRDDRGLAGQDVEAARAELVAQHLGDLQKAQAALGLLLHDLQRGAHGGHRGRRKARGKHEGTRGVLQVIDDGLLAGDEAADRRQALAEGAHHDIDFVEHAQMLGRARAGGAEDADAVRFIDKVRAP